MMNVRTRKLIAILALSVPVFLAARGLDAGRSVAAPAGGLAALATASPASGSVIDLWYLWSLRHALAPTGVRVADADASMTRGQQESQP